MTDKKLSTTAATRAEKAFKRQAEAQIVNRQVAEDELKRDANTARLKALRLERDRAEAEAKATELKAPVSGVKRSRGKGATKAESGGS